MIIRSRDDVDERIVQELQAQIKAIVVPFEATLQEKKKKLWGWQELDNNDSLMDDYITRLKNISDCTLEASSKLKIWEEYCTFIGDLGAVHRELVNSESLSPDQRLLLTQIENFLTQELQKQEDADWKASPHTETRAQIKYALDQLAFAKISSSRDDQLFKAKWGPYAEKANCLIWISICDDLKEQIYARNPHYIPANIKCKMATIREEIETNLKQTACSPGKFNAEVDRLCRERFKRETDIFKAENIQKIFIEFIETDQGGTDIDRVIIPFKDTVIHGTDAINKFLKDNGGSEITDLESSFMTLAIRNFYFKLSADRKQVKQLAVTEKPPVFAETTNVHNPENNPESVSSRSMSRSRARTSISTQQLKELEKSSFSLWRLFCCSFRENDQPTQSTQSTADSTRFSIN